MSHLDEGVLQEWLDGELSGAGLALAEAHVAACAMCRAQLDELRGTMRDADGLVARLEYTPAPRRARTPRGRFGLSMGPLGIAAGLLVAVTAGLLLKRDLPRSPAPGDATSALAPEPTATAERPDGDTFRLRAGGVEQRDQAVAQAGGEEQVRKQRVAERPVPSAEAGRDEAVQHPARAMEHSVILRPRRLGALAPSRMDTLPGTFRSTYSIDGTEVVLEESARPLPSGYGDGDASSAGAGNAAGLRAEAGVSEYRWELHGAQLRLRGALSRDSLEALSKLVR